MTGMGSFVRLARPHFLLGGALLYAVGAATAPSIEVWDYLLGQAMVTSAQLTAHFVNEYADVDVDRHVVNRTWFSGGSGVLSSGGLPPKAALRAAAVTSLLTVALVGLVATRSLGAAALGVIALGASWMYSMPPVRLLDTGWGEAATSLVVAVLVPVTGSLVNGGEITAALLWAVIVLYFVHVAMMLTFELPDEATDRAAGKTVLAVRIGPARTRRLIGLAFGLAAVVAGLAAVAGELATPVRLIPAGVVAALVLAAARTRRFHLATASAVAVLVLAALGFLGSV